VIRTLLIVITTIAGSLVTVAGTAHAATVTDPAALVNPFIGTELNNDFSTANTFPGADLPHGMIQWSPDTPSRPAGGGYDYTDGDITGFSLTHVSGPGCAAGGDVQILPVTDSMKGAGEAGGDSQESFSHGDETASPGYYQAALGNGTNVQLTTATRAGIGQFTFPATTTASLQFDLTNPDNGYVSSTFNVVGDDEVTGSVTSSGFCQATNDFTVYFAIDFGQDFTSAGTYADGGYATFDTESSQVITARAGISYTSIAEAQDNLSDEVGNQSFATVESNAQTAWTNALDKIQIAGGTTAEQTTFYTALYHAEQFPAIVSNDDGTYLGWDGQPHTVDPGHSAEYGDYSGWDIYRSQAQLAALLDPSAANDMAQSIVDDYEQTGQLTKWGMNTGETDIMVGDSGVPILADYYAFGATGFDTASALKGMIYDQSNDTDVTPGVTYLNSFGYLPTNSSYGCCNEYATASTQLEYDIDDFALSRFASALGDTTDATTFLNRAQDWENIYDASQGLLWPKHSNGDWLSGYDPDLITSTSSNDFAEGDAFTYTGDIPFNLAGLGALKGGSGDMVSYLNSVLSGYEGVGSVLGTQANLGNEPSIELPWEYDWYGAPQDTQSSVRAIEDGLWSDSPGGIPGNDDLGEMSSWYVWSALGLYPEVPGTADLAIGSPLFTSAVITTGSGTLTIDAPNAADDAPYVDGLTINGAASSLAYLPASDVLARDTTLDFTLGTSASTWATATADAPPSYGGTPGTGVAEPAGQITENGTGKCVDDRDSSTSNFNPVQVYTCNGTDAQKWTVVPDGTLQAFGDCLDVDDSGTTSGTLVDLHTCNGTGAQLWKQNSAGELVNPESGLCLTDSSGAGTNSTQLTIATCTGDTGQLWSLP
jgi:predicted alpha-1,2-mannosidase